MKTKNTVLSILLLVAFLSVAAYGVNSFRTISVADRAIGVEIDGVDAVFRDVTGKEAEPLLYDGTTYVPLRGAAEYLGYEVMWDAENGRVVLFSKKETAPANDPDDLVFKLELYANPEGAPAQSAVFTLTQDGILSEITANDYAEKHVTYLRDTAVRLLTEKLDAACPTIEKQAFGSGGSRNYTLTYRGETYVFFGQDVPTPEEDASFAHGDRVSPELTSFLHTLALYTKGGPYDRYAGSTGGEW